MPPHNPDSTAGPATLHFQHACCTRPAEWPDGHLVLAMRKPRGTWLKAVRDAGGEWLREAGPSLDLLNAYRAGALDWTAFADRYRQEMREERPAVLDEIIALAQTDPARPVIVLCWERLDHKNPHCHRTLLVELLVERARARGLLGVAAPLTVDAEGESQQV